MEEVYNNKTQDDLAFDIEQLHYSRKLGSFKPKFAGIPDDYIPLTWTEGFLYASIVLMTIGSVLGMMIGFMFWIMRHGLADFAAIWSAIFLAFVVIMIFAFYFGGKNRIREEKKLIALAQKK